VHDTLAWLVKVLEGAFSYCTELVFQEVLHLMRYSDSLPGQFGGLLEAKTTPNTLAALKKSYYCFIELSKHARVDALVKAEMELCVWPTFSWVLEILVGLDEYEFKELCSDLEAEVRGWSRCPKSTKMVENLFNYCRGLMTARAKTMSSQMVQHSSVQSREDVAMDRQVTKPTPQAKLESAGHTDPLAFKADANNAFSLGDHLLEDYIASNRSELSPFSFLMSGLRWKALQHAAPRFDQALEYWRSLLLQQGSLVYAKTAKANAPEGLVIGTTDRGAIVLPVTMHRDGSIIFCKLDLSGPFTYKVIHVQCSQDWMACETAILSKLPKLNSVEPSCGLLFQTGFDPPAALEKLHAKTGFKGLTVERMKIIVHDWTIPLGEKPPRLEKDWALLLVKFFLPSLSHAEAMLCVEARSLRNVSPFTRVITEDTLSLLQKQGELDEDDLGKFQKVVDAEKLAMKVGKSALKIAKTGPDCLTGSGYGYVPKGIPNKALSLAEARTFTPKRLGCVLSLNKDAAWEIKTPYREKTPKSHSVAFSSWESNRAALVECLKWAWAVEQEIDPNVACPFDFETPAIDFG